MAKFIVNKDGSRMLVSDDVPEDIEETGFGSLTKATTEAIPVVEPVNVLVYFSNEYPTIPIQTSLFVVCDIKLKLVGTMLLNDYVWLLENRFEEISYLEIRTAERAYKVASGPIAIKRILGKDLNATTANVHLSLKKYI